MASSISRQWIMIVTELNLVFLHPSKTGGTSVEKALLSALLRGPLSDLERKHYAIWDKGSSQHWPLAHLLRRRPEVANYRQVMTVRHPYHRFVSEFNYQVAGNRYKVSPFEQFYRSNDVNGAILSGALWQCKYPWHGAKQCDYLGATTEIMRLETLSQDWARCFPEFEALPHEMKSRSVVTVADLDDESKAEIVRRYEEDFRVFNYEP